MTTRKRNLSRPDHPPPPLPAVHGIVKLAIMFALLLAAAVGGCTEAITALDRMGDELGVAEIQVSPANVEIAVGEKAQLAASALDSSGDVVSTDPSDYTWSSSNDDVSTVSPIGEVTAISEGTVTITADLDGEVGEATVVATASEDDSGEPSDGDSASAPRVEVSPDELTLEVGQREQLEASAFDSDGDPISTVAADYEWASSDAAIATVDATGEVTAVSEGPVTISASLDGQVGEASVAVTASQPNSDSGEWDFVLADTLVVGDVVVPDGEAWLIGPNVQVEGNVRTMGGTIAMRPGSSLEFLGGDPDKYVGGGLTYGPEFADDIGLWIGHMGVLDIRGTPKTGWNRTGSDPTWDSGDEYWIAPTAIGDYEPRRWFPGDPIPQADPRVPPAEVLNVTRDVVIEGPGHVHIHSQRPQRIEYVRLEGLGVSSASHDGPVLGRYALHLHHGGDGTRGTVIRGVAAVNSKGRVFVPHESHGITMIDNVSVNSFGPGLFWDESDRTNDLLVDRLAVVGVHMPPETSGTSRRDAIENRGGDNMVMRNSVAVGARGSEQSSGFHWPSKADNDGPAMWDFTEGNVAHNNEGPGIRFWFNNRDPHLTTNVIAYRNGLAGIETGAYTNAIRYEDVLLIDNHILHHSSGKEATEPGSGQDGPSVDGRGPYYERVHVHASQGPALEFGELRGTPEVRSEWIDCTLEAGPGSPKVVLGHPRTENPFVGLFRRCGLVPDDIAFLDPIPTAMEGTSILIEHEDGRRWEITVENGSKVVNEL